MKRAYAEKLKYIAFVFLLSVATLSATGCSGKGVGDTVPTPPRALVEKSFHPPANVPVPGARSNTPR